MLDHLTHTTQHGRVVTNMAYTRAQIDAVISLKLGTTAVVDRLRLKGDGTPGDSTLKIKSDSIKLNAQHLALKANNGALAIHPQQVAMTLRRFQQHYLDVKALP